MSEHLDAALRLGPLADSSLVARRLGALQRGLFAAPGYLRLIGAPAHPSDLAMHAAVRLLNRDEPGRWRLVSRADGSQVFDVPTFGRFVAGSVSMVLELILRGAGIGAVDERMARSALSNGHLERVLPGWQLSPTPLHLVTASRLMPARVRLFGDMLTSSLAERPSHDGRDSSSPRQVAR